MIDLLELHNAYNVDSTLHEVYVVTNVFQETSTHQATMMIS